MARIDLNRYDPKPADTSRFDAGRQDRRQYQSQNRSQQHGGGQPSSDSASNCGPATAPYNFIPYDPAHLVPANEEGEKYSGVIRCSLEAQTPLLVAGPQDRKSGDGKQNRQRHFLKVNGKPVIPGSSLKGMLRNVIEILSHSHMGNVNATKMFWRDVTGGKAATYKDKFEADPVGGFLMRDGSRYFLYPATVRKCKASGPDVFQTGNFGGKPGTFYQFAETRGKKQEVPREVMAAFFAQMTPYQEKVWEKEKKRLVKDGARVFYTRDGNKEVTCIGLARYFRVPYKYTARDKTGQSPENDFAATLFGHTGKVAVKGKIAIGPAVLENAEEYDCVRAVLGQPHPTCLLHYLEQPKKTKVSGYRREELKSWDDDDARIRGWKFYWHRNAEESNPNAKENVSADYYPLKAEASATFDVHVEQASLVELGAVLEALQLPAGHCHKLGTGKSLGFGSVRIELEKVEICAQKDRYQSLAARFSAKPVSMPEEEQAKAKKAFREHVANSVGKGIPYEQLPAVKAFAAMTNFDQRPANAATKTMPLVGKNNGEPNFAKSKALLPNYDRVAKRGRP